ncbi:MAG: hypothetical protein RLZ61_2054, partial [Planctomycetota bacterium]
MLQEENKAMISDIRMKGFKEKKDVIEFLNIIDDKVAPQLVSELISIHQAAGRVLASSITSQVKVPNFNRSAMDGYAILGAETFGA